MNKLVRGVITGGLIGAGVGVVMLVMRNRNRMMRGRGPQDLNERTMGTMRMVKDNAMRWTSAVKSGTQAFSRRLAQRTS